ncbi:MAG: signal peptidase II [Deltaproteobacteria bacterium]|nr:signal peptidase II [Deltaproteobacteria bacterium]MCX7952059.1 signal peptidase II [Deltaproteobacteria bacterium]
MKTLYVQIIYILLACICVAFDLYTKFLVNKYLELGESITILEGFFNITNVHNYGFAFGVLSQSSVIVKSTFSIFIAGFLLFLFVWLFFFEKVTLKKIALLMIFSGGVGNLIDRLTLGYVRDFFDFYYESFHWPAFNLADVYITIGIFLYFVVDLFYKRPKRN